MPDTGNGNCESFAAAAAASTGSGKVCSFPSVPGWGNWGVCVCCGFGAGLISIHFPPSVVGTIND